MFAQVIVDVPVKQVNRPFDYRIPTIFEGEIEVGMRVVVPFAGRSVQGFVVSIRPTSDFDGELKEIERLMDLEPVKNNNKKVICIRKSPRSRRNFSKNF